MVGVGGRVGVQGGRGGGTGDLVEVELEIKEEEKVFLSVLKVEMEFKEEEEEEQVVLIVLEVEGEFKEEEEEE